MRTRIAFSIVAAGIAVLWSSLFLRSREAVPSPPSPRRQLPVADAGPEARAYAPDSVFRPDVDRVEPMPFPAGTSRAVSTRFGPTDTRPFSYFGHAVALDGDTALVGAPYDDGEGMDAGAAYVFRHDGTSWRQLARLTAPESWDFDRFGFSVAVRDRMAVVGADRRGRRGAGDCGAVYVFREAAGRWGLEAVLQPEDLGSHDGLGISVAVDADTILAGAPGQGGSGAAYVFVRDGRGWRKQAVLAAPPASGYSGFGHAVALSGATALVGAPTVSEPAVFSGAAYVFRRRGEDWRLEARLASAEAAPLEKFGAAVALFEDVALAGAPRATLGGSTRAGAVFVFQRHGGTWRQAARITAPQPRSDEEFGRAVSLAEDRAVVGSIFGDAAGLNTGVAYLFEHRGAAWSPGGTVLAGDAATVDEFGASVATSGARTLIGAPRWSGRGNAIGAAYVVEPRLSPRGGAP